MGRCGSSKISLHTLHPNDQDVGILHLRSNNTIEAFENSKEIRKKAHENHGSNQNTTNNISEDVPMVLDDGKQKNALTN